MSLKLLQKQMKWPPREAVLTPSGYGPQVLVDLVQRKIETAIRRIDGGGADVHVGVLTKNPDSNNTESPLAVVCEFPKPVSDAVLTACHKLAWNFVRSPLLITVEPHKVRTWTCCEPPTEATTLLGNNAEIEDARLDLTCELSPSQQAAHALHWVRLASGDFYRQFPDRFRQDGRADRCLLEALTAVRRRLADQNLNEDKIHDLLARVVFSQFLFDRKDTEGRAAINSSLLSRLYKEDHLAQEHNDLGSILADHDEAYRFFRWLNEKFNGDLFPGKGSTSEEREIEWQKEMKQVKPKHLQTLADFVGGKLQGRQRVLWRLYSFDVIPLEFISSIYEEFVTAKGAHYTPGFLVDFMLDEVLPWGGTEWDIKILDPACGSGIFLVKAYQRLIQRWKNANPDQKLSTDLLRRLLERNLFGVDLDPHAVRVASFSLYLTMCDEIDPKSYLKSTKFPLLRDRRLIHADFFREDTDGFSTEKNNGSYHLVIGNAPWGKDTETKFATTWAKNPDHQWDVPNKAVGTLFLAKAATLAKPDGRVSMIQPAGSLLFNRSGPANRVREKLFSQYKVEEVVNLSTLRFELFENAISPPCIVTLRPTEPDGEPLVYISPKQVKSAGGAEVSEGQYTVVIEPHDISRIWPDEAASDPLVWTALAWGGRRDWGLLNKLQSKSHFQKISDLKHVVYRKGLVRASRQHRHDQTLNRRILEQSDFPEDVFLYIDADSLPLNKDPYTHRMTDLAAFKNPQLIIKKSWVTKSGRFQSAITRAGNSPDGILCTQSYVSVSATTDLQQQLIFACLSLNSILAVYSLLLSSGRLASYRPEPLVAELLRVPVAPVEKSALMQVKNYNDVDKLVLDTLGLKNSEISLIRDIFDFTLPDFKGDETSPGRQPTERNFGSAKATKSEPHLSAYCEYFIRVLKAGFGPDKGICATIYQDAADSPLPVRLVAIHLDWQRDEKIVVEPIDSAGLCDLLMELDKKWLTVNDHGRGGIFYQRVALVYAEYEHERRTIPTVYIVKPDRIRYWTRSTALRDADEVATDVQLWQQQSKVGGGKRQK